MLIGTITSDEPYFELKMIKNGGGGEKKESNHIGWKSNSFHDSNQVNEYLHVCQCFDI